VIYHECTYTVYNYTACILTDSKGVSIFFFTILDESVKWFEMWTEWSLKISLHPDPYTQVHRSKSGSYLFDRKILCS